MFIRLMYSTLFQISSRFFFMSTFNSISLWKPLNHVLFLLSFLFGNHFSICNGNKLNLCCRLNIIYQRGISSMYTAVFSSLYSHSFRYITKFPIILEHSSSVFQNICWCINIWVFGLLGITYSLVLFAD